MYRSKTESRFDPLVGAQASRYQAPLLQNSDWLNCGARNADLADAEQLFAQCVVMERPLLADIVEKVENRILGRRALQLRCQGS
jgi:hypothetical protein